MKEMFLSPDREIVELGMSILTQTTDYEDLLRLHCEYFNIFMMPDIIGKVHWEITPKRTINSLFVKDPTRTLKLKQSPWKNE